MRQAEVLGPLARGRKRRADVDRAALLLGISTSNAYRLISLLAADPRPTALLPRPPGPDAGLGLLDAGVEAVISEVIERSYCSSQKPKESGVIADIRRKASTSSACVIGPPGSAHWCVRARDLSKYASTLGTCRSSGSLDRPDGSGSISITEKLRSRCGSMSWLLLNFGPRQGPSWSVHMLERAYELTSGYVGRASYLVQEASVQAVLSGSEQITGDILESRELSNSLAALKHAKTRAGGRTKRSST